MGLVDTDTEKVREDKLSVFHSSSKAHAGTLTITEVIVRNGPGGSWTWTWTGGPFGPLAGVWDSHLSSRDSRVWFLLRLYDNIAAPRGERAVTNARWGDQPFFPSRPWFKSGDDIRLFDANFRTRGSPDGHTFVCKVI